MGFTTMSTLTTCRADSSWIVFYRLISGELDIVVHSTFQKYVSYT